MAYPDGTPFYVGKGKGKRYQNCGNSLSRKIAEDLARRDETIRVTLHMAKSEYDAFVKEVELIKLYGRKDLGEGPLCNLSDGRVRGKRRDEPQGHIVWPIPKFRVERKRSNSELTEHSISCDVEKIAPWRQPKDSVHRRSVFLHRILNGDPQVIAFLSKKTFRCRNWEKNYSWAGTVSCWYDKTGRLVKCRRCRREDREEAQKI